MRYKSLFDFSFKFFNYNKTFYIIREKKLTLSKFNLNCCTSTHLGFKRKLRYNILFNRSFNKKHKSKLFRNLVFV